MNLDQRKMVLMAMLIKVRSESLINQMEELLKKEMIVGYTTAGEPLTEKENNDRLAKAEKNYLEDKWLSQEDAEKESDQW
jgi:ribosomal protein S7